MSPVLQNTVSLFHAFVLSLVYDIFYSNVINSTSQGGVFSKDYETHSNDKKKVALPEYAKFIAVPSFREWGFIRSSLEYKVAASSSSLGFFLAFLL